MNKEELINSFESLTPSPAQKERMLANVLNAKAEKNVHKVSFNFRYAFSTAAAAVCVLAVVVAVGPMYKYHKISETSNQNVTTTETTDDKPVVQTETAETEDTVNIATALPDVAAENKKAETQQETTSSNEVTYETDAVATAEETPDEYNENMPSSRMMIMDDSVKAYTPHLNINQEVVTGYGITGGTPKAEKNEEIITLQQYYDYLGVNVENILDIPAGYSNSTIQDNLMDIDHNDRWVFEYSKDNGYIRVITTKDTNYISQAINNGYVTSDINGKTAVVLETNKVYKAYIISNDIAYTIYADDISEEDLSNLLLSIAG